MLHHWAIAEHYFLFIKREPGYHLLSHTVSRAVPSAVIGLTILFGMGRGVTQKHIITRCMLSQNLRFCHETALIRTYVRRSFLFVSLTSDFLTTISLKECSFKIAYKWQPKSSIWLLELTPQLAEWVSFFKLHFLLVKPSIY